jgi:AhpD family alkylhydroperoxidase
MIAIRTKSVSGHRSMLLARCLRSHEVFEWQHKPDRNGGSIMANHYHDENDLKLLKEMSKLAPEEFKAWVNLDGIVARENGRIPRKYRELIALAVAHTTQCVYCIEVHTKNAKKAGASKEEVVEAVLLAAALRAGGAAAHGTLAVKFFDQE